MRDALTALLACVLSLGPLVYYLGDDADDERFAWRMFSVARVTPCRSVVLVDGRVVPLGMELHPAWQRALARGWRRIEAGVASHLCEGLPAGVIQIERTCRPLDGGAPVARTRDYRCGEDA